MSRIGGWPRFSLEARKANRPLVKVIEEFAAKKRATCAQIALAWLMARKPWIIPIPGTTKLKRLEENIESTGVELSEGDLQELDGATAGIAVEGDRYPQELERMTHFLGINASSWCETDVFTSRAMHLSRAAVAKNHLRALGNCQPFGRSPS